MSIEIDGVRYNSATDIQRDVGVARQTLWRWRKDRKIPQGRRYRDRQVLFTQEEVDEIREYANRLEPAEIANSAQLKLFRSAELRQQQSEVDAT
jgi:predicted DNA-binding transcriptional regulator AlpA